MSPNGMNSKSSLKIADLALVAGEYKTGLPGEKAMSLGDSMKTDESSSLPASKDFDETQIEQDVATLDVLSNNASSTTPAPKDFSKPQSEEEVAAIEAVNYAVLENGEEDLEDAEKAAKESQYSLLAEKLLHGERAQGIVVKRTMQATIHTAFTELRIQELEEQLRQVKKDLYNLPDDFEFRKKKKMHPTFCHVLQRSGLAEFKLTKDLMKIPSKDHPALEALVIEQLKDTGTHSELSAPHRRPTELSKGPLHTYRVPESLRIRPRPLIAHLQRVTRTHISHQLEPQIGSGEQMNIVFLRPFKLLVTYEEDIRQSLQELEKENHERSINPEGRPHKEDNENAFIFEDLLQDMRLLVDFMSADLRPTFDLRRKIQDGTATDIEYPDLWHLFKHGDIVMAELDTSHAYRVVNFRGGREPLVDRLQREQNDEKSQPILDGMVIDCLSIRYDGSNYVPQLSTFSIQPFVGHQPITSLPVYPLRFDKDFKILKRDMIAKGRQYLDVTIPPQSHKHLLGRTLDEPPHDIDAQVIVDMSMALNSVPDWRPRTNKINKDQFTKGDPRETQIPAYCHNKYNEGCCGSDFAFKDLEMDDLNVNNFLQANQYMLSARTHTKLVEEDLQWVKRNNDNKRVSHQNSPIPA